MESHVLFAQISICILPYTISYIGAHYLCTMQKELSSADNEIYGTECRALATVAGEE